MHFEFLSEGFVCALKPGARPGLAVHSRSTVTNEGEIVCHYVLQEKLGCNDFQPRLARSSDGGRTWTHQGLWPHLWSTYSIIGAISRSPSGDIFFFGARTRIDQPGETFWCEATQGLKQNELIWARSTDGGRTWSEPSLIPIPTPGSAETCSAMCVTRNGYWVCCYAPYNTFDPKLVVPRNQIVCLWSSDQGKAWQHSAMFRFPHRDSTAAGSYVTELIDGRLLGVTWHINETLETEPPNPYALSKDGGRTWGPALATGIFGQSTGLTALPDGRVLFIYNQRKHGERGVWLALAKPTDSDFGLQANEIIWRAERTTQSATTGDHSAWTDFAFGAPSIVVLPDGTLLATLWCTQPSGSGIRYVKLRMKN